MLLPRYQLRKRKLQRALALYPIYDPPHKMEERVLAKPAVQENFEYFMGVRHARARFFNAWIDKEFGFRKYSPSEHNLDNIFEWAKAYVGILLPRDPQVISAPFFDYSVPWIGEYAGANPLFDLAIFLGESLIRLRPEILWRTDWSLAGYNQPLNKRSAAEIDMLHQRECDIAQLRVERNSGCGRPLLVSSSNPLRYEPVFDIVYTYFGLMTQATTVSYMMRNLDRPERLKSGNQAYLKTWFQAASNR